MKHEEAMQILQMYKDEMGQRIDKANAPEVKDVYQWQMDGFDMAIKALEASAWIPVVERLPEAEDMYQPPEQRYLCQLEAYGERKFCVLSRLKGAVSPFWDWYGVAVHDSEVTAWMPLPEPYRGGDDNGKD